MKNILLLLCFLLVAGMGFSQVKVHSTGDIGVNDIASTPRAMLDINRHTTTRTTAQFGTFGIQSFNNTNGFLIKNALWNGSAYQTRAAGKAAWLHLFQGEVRMRTTPAYGANTAIPLATVFDNIVCKNNGTVPFVGINTVSPTHTLTVNGSAFKNTGGSNWSIPSDKRLKKNVEKLDIGLDLILQLNPLKYEYNGKAGTVKGENSIGVMAQELQSIAPFMVSEFKYQEENSIENTMLGQDEKNLESESFLSINPSALKWITVNAIKEQQVIIDSQNERIDNLEIIVENLIKKLEAQSEINVDLVGEGEDQDAFISQNIPNPFSDDTVIKYRKPSNTSSASLQIYNTNGQLIKTVDLDSANESGTINIQSIGLPSGVYNYSYLVDGQVVGTKKMVISK